jgi:hypothetical protein
MIITKNVFMFVAEVLFSKMFSTCSLQRVSSASDLSNQCMLRHTYIGFDMSKFFVFSSLVFSVYYEY